MMKLDPPVHQCRQVSRLDAVIDKLDDLIAAERCVPPDYAAEGLLFALYDLQERAKFLREGFKKAYLVRDTGAS